MLIKKQTHLLFPLFNDTTYYLLYVLAYSKGEINLELAGNQQLYEGYVKRCVHR